MLAGFMMWGFAGPLAVPEQCRSLWGLISSKFIGNLILVLMNIFLIPLFVMILRVPYTILMGSSWSCQRRGLYVNNNLFDVWMMLGFAVLATR